MVYGVRLFLRACARQGFPNETPLRNRLEKAGVLMIDDLGIDTYSDERCYSYRRSVHRKEADYGRHVHAIALEERT